MAGKKDVATSKTNVTARDKTARLTTHTCSRCAKPITDRDLLVVKQLRGWSTATYHRDCYRLAS
jgi:hypothetical protein